MHGARAGRGTLVARNVGGRTVLVLARADSPLRFVQPAFPGTRSASACLVTFGGGLVDGDAIDVDVTVEAGATLVLFTQSTTKVFRGASRQSVRAKVEGTLVFLPDPVAAFMDAFYTQRVDVELAGAGACVLMDGYTSGRAAFGERWAMRGLDLRTTVTHAGRTVLFDGLHLDAAHGPIAPRTGAFDAFATLVAIGPGVATIADGIEHDRIAPPSPTLAVATSAIPRAETLGLRGAVARIAARSPAEALGAARARLRNLPDIDVMDPFASRY